MHRRGVLASLSSASIGGAAVCVAALGNRGEDVHLGRIILTNQTQRERTAHVDVYRGDERVFSATETVAAYDDEAGVVPGTDVHCGWPSAPGRYRVDVRFDGHETASIRVFETESARDADDGERPDDREDDRAVDCYAAVADLLAYDETRTWFARCRSTTSDPSADVCPLEAE
ncbi:hypothetical protein C491_10019 [Natronococcus amylolyticus DSM 10524]|uniref:Uncharacterized protein n=2 Tax=Natronococcus amylolyticus TaxID=44470 RepID=L9XBY7_9EURY|nr:hypothetical protein C491_10019 [Natronococcus amylolyticus DSM 10524]